MERKNGRPVAIVPRAMYIFDFKLLVNFKKRNHTKRENEANTIYTFIGMILSPDNLYKSIEKENGTEIE